MEYFMIYCLVTYLIGGVLAVCVFKEKDKFEVGCMVLTAPATVPVIAFISLPFVVGHCISFFTKK